MCRVPISKIARRPRSKNQKICWTRAENVGKRTKIRRTRTIVARNLSGVLDLLALEALLDNREELFLLGTLFNDFLMIRRYQPIY